MVQQQGAEVEVQVEAGVPPVPAEETYLPRRSQPWELAMVIFGVPGAMVSALALSGLAVFAANGDALVAAAAAALIVGGYLGGMAVLAFGVASERA